MSSSDHCASDKRRSIRLEDIPVMNSGKYVLDKMKTFKDQEALVSISFTFS